MMMMMILHDAQEMRQSCELTHRAVRNERKCKRDVKTKLNFLI